MGFGKKWIKRCVICARVSVLVNGSASGEFMMEGVTERVSVVAFTSQFGFEFSANIGELV